MKKSVDVIIKSALFAAFIFLGTQFIKIPLAFGYFNFGDVFVLLCGYFVGGIYGATASAVGSALADLLSGYAVYIPATVIIKSVMALTVFEFCRTHKKSKKVRLRFVISAIFSELIMIFGYFIFDSLLYGSAGAVISLPGNLLQSAAAVTVSYTALLLIERIKPNM